MDEQKRDEQVQQDENAGQSVAEGQGHSRLKDEAQQGEATEQGGEDVVESEEGAVQPASETSGVDVGQSRDEPPSAQGSASGVEGEIPDVDVPEGGGHGEEIEIEEMPAGEADALNAETGQEKREVPVVVSLRPGAERGQLPLPGAEGSKPAPFDPKQQAVWQQELAALEREIAALGDVPAAATLYYEAGRIWEEKLAQPRNAWNYYNKAFQLRPDYLPNIRAAGRLAAQVGNWNVAVQIIDSEIEASRDDQHKAFLYHRKGLILEQKLGKAAEAMEAYRKACAMEPECIEFHKSLERLALASGDWQEVVRVRLHLADIVKDKRYQVQLLLGCARIRERLLGDEDGAADLYRRAVELDPGCLEAMASLRQYYAARGQFESQLEVLEKEAAATADPSVAAWLLYQAARLLRERLGDEERALEVLQRVLALVPGHQMALAEMANILESLMKWQELVDVYQKMVEAVNDRQEKVALLFKIGNLWEEKLFDEDRAVEAYKRVVELNPRYLPALQALGKLYYRKGKWSELVEMYELEVRETSDDRQKAVRLYKLAEILEERLGREEDAIARLEQSLELNPGYLPVLKSLGRLYTKYGRWESLVNMYEKELASTRDRDQQVFLLDKIGTLWDEKLNNIDKAIESYQRLLEVAPNYLPAVRTLGKLYVQADRWQDLIEINNKEAQMVNDQKQVVSLLHRNAEIYEEKLGDKDKAIETYKQVLALAPAYLPALQSLGRLYFIKGRWEDLIDMYRQEIEVTTNEDQHIALLYKIGQLYEEKLLQEDKAVAAYREVLRIRPGNMAALKALIRIYSNKRDWENLIEIYQQEADTLEDPAQKAISLYRVAEICLHHLGDMERASSVLLKVLDLVPEHSLAIRLLMELYTKQQNWRGLVELCERNLAQVASEKQKVRLLSLMADVYAMRMGDLARAAELYEQVLKLQPDYGPALEALERILLSQRNFAGLLRIYRYLAESGADPQLRLALYFQLADMKENRLQPAQPSGDDLVRMLEIEPAHPEASRLLEIQYVKFGTWKGLLALYERALQVVDDKQEALDLCMRAADLCASRLEDPAGAEHYYNEVLRLAPGYLPAIRALHRMYEEQGETSKLLHVLELEERALVDKQQVLKVLKEKAELQLERLDQPASAVDTLLRVLELEPADGESFEKLDRILRQQQDYDRLALVLRKRVDVVEEPAQKAQLLCELAEIIWKQQGRLAEAMAQFSRALEIQPSNDRAVEALAELAFLNEQWDLAIEYGNKLLELTTAPERLGPVHRRLGIVYQEHRPDLELAVQHLERACELGGDDLEVLGRLKTIHTARQAWEDVVGVLERIYAAETDKDGRIAAALEQADILEKQLNQPERAVAALKRVLEHQPERADVIQRLSLLYENLGRWEELVESLEGFIAMLPPEREQEKIPLHLKLAQIWRERLNNVEKAIIEYKKVVSINPRHVEAHEKLAELYGSSGLYFANAIDEHRTLLEINPYRIDSYHEMRRIFEQQRAFDKMLCVCSVLHYLRAADQNEEFFYGENRTKIPDRSSERLSEQEIEGILVHPKERGIVRRLMKIVRGHLHKVFPAQLERYGVGKSDRARPDDPVRNLVEGMVANLGEFDVEIYLSSQPNHLVAVENTSPPALIVGEGLIKRSVVKEQRFALGRAVKLAGDGSYLALLLGEKNLAQLVAALVEPYVPQSPIVSYPGQLPAGFSKKVHKALPRKVRKELEKELQQSQETGKVPDYAAYLEAVELSADRFGLLMCNDVAQAMLHKSRHVPDLRDRRFDTPQQLWEALAKHPEMGQLLIFAVSEEYFRLRAKMKFSLV